MQYLLNDLIKLPLNDRLYIIETAICSLATDDYIISDDKETIVNKIKFWKSKNRVSVSENSEKSI